MTEPQKLRVFLSYTHADISPVRKLYEDLNNQGYEVWFDEESLIPGQEWKTEIEKALENSDAVVVCLSNNSVSKEGFVQREFKFALDKALEMTEDGIFLIPVRLNECKVPTKLSRYHWVDLFTDNGIHRLLKALSVRASQVAKKSNMSQEAVRATPNQKGDGLEKNGVSFNAPAAKEIKLADGELEIAKRPVESEEGNDFDKSKLKSKMTAENATQDHSYKVIPAAKEISKPIIESSQTARLPFWAWPFTYIPIIPAVITFIILSSTVTPFTNALVVILAILFILALQWLILRSLYEKTAGWIMFNFLLLSYSFLFCLILSAVFNLIYVVLVTDISTSIVGSATASFWIVITVWILQNFWVGTLVNRNDVRLKYFFSDSILNISFLNKWGISPLLSFVTILVFFLVFQLNSGTLFVMFGIICGFFQWRVLRPYFISWWWIVASMFFGVVFWIISLDTGVTNFEFLLIGFYLLIWLALNVFGGPLLVWLSTKRKMKLPQ